MENDKIKDLFASKLGSFEPEVPASVWGGLDLLLSSQPIPTPDASSSHTADPSSSSSSSSSSSTSHAASSATKASIIKTVAIAVGLAAAVVTGVLLVPDSKDAMVEPNTIVEQVVTPPTEEVVDTVMEVPATPQIARAITPRTTKPATEVPEETILGAPKAPDAPKEEVKPKKEKKPAPETLIAEAKLEETPTKRSSKGFSIGLHSNSGLTSDQMTAQGGDALFSSSDRGDLLKRTINEEYSNLEIVHRQPISLGLTFSKQFTRRLSLETGVVYTRLSSKLTSNSVFNIKETQEFDYLGIPLSLNYTFYELGKAKFYISLGGMVQKDIHGKYVSNMGVSVEELENKGIPSQLYYSEPFYINKNIKQDNPQFSVHSTLGVKYPLYKKLYLYGTMGGAYYFDAGNKYRTIYSDKKTQLNLNLGVKFDF